MAPPRPPLPRGAYLVAGLGRAGGAAVSALLGRPEAETVLAWDRAENPRVRGVARRLRGRGVAVTLGGDGLAALDAAGDGAIVVKSPGIDPAAPLLERARTRGSFVLDELELGWRTSPAAVVGVTGTNGKSTTAKLAAAVLAAGGHDAQLVGNTEFGPPLSGARESAWVVCEVSSFQLDASPAFLPDVAVFTNLTPEHLTRHGGMERYGEVKRRMFLRAGAAAGASVVNVDDPFGRDLAARLHGAGARVLTYGCHVDADVRIGRADWDMRGARMELVADGRRVECSTRLPGAHNAHNVAAAFAVGRALELPAGEIVAALGEATAPPGRWELVSEREPFDVLVDYAHTPDGIRQLLGAVRTAIADRPGARVLTVFGAVGLRDAEKACESGRLAGRLSDRLILTTGSAPRDPRVLRMDELRRAATAGGEVEMVLDRRAAIRRAIESARPGDVVAVLGLGALDRIALDAAGTTEPNDDRATVREILRR